MTEVAAPSPPRYVLAPYVPTPPEVVERMLDLAGVTSADVVYDLGCGDGRVVIAAAKRGARGFGVDIEAHWVERGAQERSRGWRRDPSVVRASGRPIRRSLTGDRRHAVSRRVVDADAGREARCRARSRGRGSSRTASAWVPIGQRRPNNGSTRRVSRGQLRLWIAGKVGAEPADEDVPAYDEATPGRDRARRSHAAAPAAVGGLHLLARTRRTLGLRAATLRGLTVVEGDFLYRSFSRPIPDDLPRTRSTSASAADAASRPSAARTGRDLSGSHRPGYPGHAVRSDLHLRSWR